MTDEVGLQAAAMIACVGGVDTRNGLAVRAFLLLFV